MIVAVGMMKRRARRESMAKGEERSGLKRRGSGECNARQSRGLRLTIDHKGTPKAGDIRS